MKYHSLHVIIVAVDRKQDMGIIYALCGGRKEKSPQPKRYECHCRWIRSQFQNYGCIVVIAAATAATAGDVVVGVSVIVWLHYLIDMGLYTLTPGRYRV